MKLYLANYRFAFTILTVLACISISFQNTISYIVGTLFLALGLYFAFKYRCPNCKKAFDPRLSPRRLEFCPKCGKKVDWYNE